MKILRELYYPVWKDPEGECWGVTFQAYQKLRNSHGEIDDKHGRIHFSDPVIYVALCEQLGFG